MKSESPQDETRLSTQVSFRVTDEEARRIAELARKESRKVADMVRIIFRNGLGRIK